ncbi:MAG: SAM-dependent methyltransferase [Streptosporangiaceae bacterium]
MCHAVCPGFRGPAPDPLAAHGQGARGQLPGRVGHHPRHRHGADDHWAAKYNARLGPSQFTPRTREEITRFFDGLELIDPGLVPLPQWCGLASPAQRIPALAGVARKP